MVLTANHIAGQVVAPTLVAYLLFLGALWTGFRTTTPRTQASAPPQRAADWARLVRLLVATALGGYAVFLVLILIFYLALGGQGPGLLTDALGSGALLTFAVVVPAFLAMEAARALVGRSRRRTRRT